MMRRWTLLLLLACLAAAAVAQSAKTKPAATQKKPAGQKPALPSSDRLKHLIPGVGGAVPARKKPQTPAFPNPSIPFVGPLPGVNPAPVVVPGQEGVLPTVPGLQARAVSPLLYGVNVVWGDNGTTANWDKDNGAKARRLAQLLKAAGATNTRISIRWGDVERTRGKYDWRATDRFVNFVSGLGVTPICMVTGSPDWAVDRSPAVLKLFADRGVANLTAMRPPEQSYHTDLGRFAHALVQRYKDKIKHWEFWSEPDAQGMPSVVKSAAGAPADIHFGADPKLYANLLRIFTSNARRADPAARVAVGGLRVQTSVFLSELYAGGAKPYFDAVALHPYSERDVIAMPWIDLCRSVVLRNGDAQKNFWLTEWGWPTTAPAAGRSSGLTELHQARLIRESMAAMRDRPYITQASYQSLNDWRQNEKDPSSLVSTGLNTANLMPKPGYVAFKEMAAGGDPAVAAKAFARVNLTGGLPTADEGGVRSAAVNVVVEADKPGEPVAPAWQGFSQGYEGSDADFIRSMGPRLRAVGAKFVRFDPFPNPDDVRRQSIVVEAGDTTGRAAPPAGGELKIDWRYPDDMVEMLAQAGAKPMFNFATMPSALSAPSGNTRLPRDAAEWGRFVQSVVRRYNVEQKRGASYWELSSEAGNGVFAVSEWLRFYQAFAGAVIAADPKARVGGPSLAAYDADWLKALVDYCARNDVPLHFLSWRAYGQPPAEYARQVAEMRAYLQTVPTMKDIELIVDEWNVSDRASAENDNLVGAAYALSVSEQFMNAAPARGMFFEVKEAADRRRREERLTGRWGMLTYDGKPKPVYNAFKLLSRLEGLRLPAGSEDSDIHAIASRDKNGVTVLLWSDPAVSEGAGTQRDLDSAARRPDVPVRLRLRGLPWKGATAGRQWVVDKTNANVSMDAARSELAPAGQFRAAAGDLEIPVVLSHHGIALVELTPAAAPKVELTVETPHYVVYSGSALSLTTNLKNTSTTPQSVAIGLSASDPALISPAQAKGRPFTLAPGETRSFRYVLRTAPGMAEGQEFLRVTAGPAAASVAVKFVPPVAARLEAPRVDVQRPASLPDSTNGTARLRVAVENRAEAPVRVSVAAGRAAESVTIPARRATTVPVTVSPPSTVPGNYPVPLKVSVGGSPVASVDAVVGVPALCRYATRTPRINGELSEWSDAFPIALDSQAQVLEKRWGGPGDLSAQALTMWDEKNLYIALSVSDDVHYQPYTQEEMGRGDSVLFGVDARRSAKPDQAGYDADDYEFGIANLAGGPVVYRFAGGILTANRVFGAQVAVRREGGRTIYEASIPWSDLAPLKPRGGAIAGFSLAVNDNDNDGRGRGYMEWGGGLVGTKRPGRFIGLRLVKD
jgi:hypothetical protein